MQLMESSMASYYQIGSLHLLQNFLKEARASQQSCAHIMPPATNVVIKEVNALEENRSEVNPSEQIICKNEVPKTDFASSVMEYQIKVHENLKSINDNLSQMLQEGFAGIDNICNKVRMCLLESNFPGQKTQYGLEKDKTTEPSDTDDYYVIIEESFSQTQREEKEKYVETTDTEIQAISETKAKRVKFRGQKKGVETKNQSVKTDLEDAGDNDKNTTDSETQTVNGTIPKKEKRIRKHKKTQKSGKTKKHGKTDKHETEGSPSKTIFKPFFTIINSPNTSTMEFIKLNDSKVFDDILNNMVATIQKEIRCSYAYLEGINEKISIHSNDSNSLDQFNDDGPTSETVKEEKTAQKRKAVGLPSTQNESETNPRKIKKLAENVSDVLFSDNDIGSGSDDGDRKNEIQKPILEKLIYAEADVYRKRACTNLYQKLLAQIEANDSYIFFQKLMGNYQKNIEETKEATTEKEKEKAVPSIKPFQEKPKINKVVEKPPQTFSWSWSKSNLHKAKRQENINKKYLNSLWFKTKKVSRKGKRRPIKENGTDKKTALKKIRSQRCLKAVPSVKSVPSNKDATGKYQLTVTNDMRLTNSEKCRMHWMRAKYSQLLYQTAKYPDILDRITKKDVLPLKSEYPGKHKQHPASDLPLREQVTDTYLYKMMFGDRKVVENAWTQFFQSTSVPNKVKSQPTKNRLDIYHSLYNSASSATRPCKLDSNPLIKTKTMPSVHKKMEHAKKEMSRSEIVKKLSKYMFPVDATKAPPESHRVYTIMPVQVFYDNIPHTHMGTTDRDVVIKLPLVPMRETKEGIKKAEWTTGARQNHKPMRVIIDELPKKILKDVKIASARDKDANICNGVTKIQASGSWCPKSYTEKTPMKSCIHKTQSHNTNNNSSKEKQVRIRISPKLHRPGSSSSSKNLSEDNPRKNIECIKEASEKNLTHLKTLEGSLKNLTQHLKTNEGSLKSLEKYRDIFRQIAQSDAAPNTEPRRGNTHVMNNCPVRTSDIPKILKPPNFRNQIRNFSNKSKNTNDYLALESMVKSTSEKMTEQERKIWQNKYGKSTGKKLVKFIENQPSEYKIPKPTHALPKETKSKSTVRQEQVLHHLQNLKQKNDAIQGNIQKAIDVIENKMVDILSKPDISKSIDAFDEMEKEVSNVLNMMKVNKKKQKSGESTKGIEEVDQISDELFKKLQSILDCDEESSTNSSSKASIHGDTTTNIPRTKKTVKKSTLNDRGSTSGDEKCCVTSYYSPKKHIQQAKPAQKAKNKTSKSPARNNQAIVNMSLVSREGPAGDKIKHTVEKKSKTKNVAQQDQKPIEQGDVNVENTKATDIAIGEQSTNNNNAGNNEVRDNATSVIKFDSYAIQTEQAEAPSMPLEKEEQEVQTPSNIPEKENGEDLTTYLLPDREKEPMVEPQEDKEGNLNVEQPNRIEEEPKPSLDLNEFLLGPCRQEEEVQTSANDPLDTEEELFSGTTAKDDENQTSETEEKSIRILKERTEKKITRCWATSTEESGVDQTFMTSQEDIKKDIATFTVTTNSKNKESNEDNGDVNKKHVSNEKETMNEDEVYEKIEVQTDSYFTPYVNESIGTIFHKVESEDKNMYDNFSKIIMRAEDVYTKLNEFELEADETAECQISVPQDIEKPMHSCQSLNVKVFQENETVAQVESQSFLTPFMQAVKERRKSIAAIKDDSENKGESVVEEMHGSANSSPRIERSPSYYNVINFLDTLTDENPLEKCVEVYYPRLCYYVHQVHFPVVSYQYIIEHILEYCTVSTGCLKKHDMCCLKSNKSRNRVSFKLGNDHKAIQTIKSEHPLKCDSKNGHDSVKKELGYNEFPYVTPDERTEVTSHETKMRDKQYQDGLEENNINIYKSDTSIYEDAYDRDVSIRDGLSSDNCSINVMKTSKEQLSSSESCCVEKKYIATDEKGNTSDQKTDIDISLDESCSDKRILKSEHLENNKIFSGSYNKDSLTNLREQKQKTLKLKKRDSLENFLLKRDISREILEEKHILNFSTKSIWTFLDVDLLKTAVGKRQQLRMLRRKNSMRSCEVIEPKPEEKEHLLKGFYVMMYLLVFTALNFEYKCL